MTSEKPLVFVTGASGFVGSQVVRELLEQGFRVRAGVRSGKVSLTQDAYSTYGDQIEIVTVNDIVNADLSEVLKGVGAVVHLASPLPGRATPQELLDGAIKGALNVLRQAEKIGITKFVVTSSQAAVSTPGSPLNYNGHTFTENDWNTITKEKAVDGTLPPLAVYAASKGLAERAVWEFAEQHPHVDITTINPPFIYGPFAPAFRAPEPSIASLSTNAYIYELITGTPGGDMPPVKGIPRYVDVRDVARAHVAALTSPPPSEVGRKRILFAGGWFDWKDAVEHIAAVRPELKGRLPSTANAPPIPGIIGPVDTTRSGSVLGIKEFIPWQETVIAAIDDLVKLENDWASKGLKL